MKNLFLSIVILLATVSIANADEVRGTVYGFDADNKKVPLFRATVSELGTSNGVFTDSKGKFKIRVSPKSHFLVFSFVGYERDTVHFHTHSHDGHTHIEELEVVLNPSLTTETVNVTGQKSAIEVSLSSHVKTETITSKGLHKAACCNLAESFEVSPSVDVEYSDAVSGAKRIQLLGVAGNYSQMLIEKIPALRGLGGIYGLTFVPGPWMESIQVSKGSASVTTGFESMTGQINIEYKKPENNEPTHFNVYADMMGRGEMNVNHSHVFNEHLSTMLLAHANYYNTKHDGNSDGFIDKPLVTQINLQNRWKYQAEVYESVSGARALIEERKGGQMGFFPKKDASLYGIDVKTKRYEVFTKNGFVFNDEPFSSLGTIISFSHHEQESFFGLRDYNAEQNSFYANILYQQELWGHNAITSGFSYQYDNYLEKFDGIDGNRFESIPGVFSEFTFHPLDNLTLLAGLRADFPNQYNTFISPRFHVKYTPDELTTFRASAGKGFKIPHIFAEHTGLLASSRKVQILETLRPEEAWNYGVNASTIANIFGWDFTFNAEYYRTDFIEQVVYDLDRDVQSAVFYNLDGRSYSNSVQFDVQFEPISQLVLTTAYRMNDVKMTIDGKLQDKPLQSRHKGFFNAMYDTPDNGWNFDWTIEYNGGGRLPNTEKNPEQYRLKKDFPDFVTMNAQITKRFKNWDLYVGGENLTNFTQKNPIIAASTPTSEYFDSSMIWGPVLGRMFYAGIRLNFN